MKQFVGLFLLYTHRSCICHIIRVANDDRLSMENNIMFMDYLEIINRSFHLKDQIPLFAALVARMLSPVALS